MDLHAWITKQVDDTEVLALAADADLGNVIAQVEYIDGLVEIDQRHIARHRPATVLRRCEADRRILAIHYNVDDGYTVACDGCGTAGICDDWITENVNDCPILLALAHAHGITEEILASLDRPQPPEPKPATGRLGLADILATSPITTSDVPAALRGPRWKP